MAIHPLYSDREAQEKLIEALLSLQSKEECRAFLEDLCTIKELQDMAQRLEVAFLLDSGLSYQKIVEQTGVSSATITRVNRCLSYGSGGYRSVIDAEKQLAQACQKEEA